MNLTNFEVVNLFLCRDLSLEQCSLSSISNVFIVAWALNFSSDILSTLIPFSVSPLHTLDGLEGHCTHFFQYFWRHLRLYIA